MISAFFVPLSPSYSLFSLEEIIFLDYMHRATVSARKSRTTVASAPVFKSTERAEKRKEVNLSRGTLFMISVLRILLYRKQFE